MSPQLDISTLPGLTEHEAAERLSKEGYNEMPSARPRSVFAIVLSVVREPIFVLLVGAGSVYLVLGDLEEALMLLGFVLVVIGITVYQERKTENALQALRSLASPRARVIRSFREMRIPGREVVYGDVVLLAEGDRVPADAVILDSTNLYCDESLLTGESVPVRKTNWDGLMAMATPGGDNLPFVYSGSLVVRGQGVVEVRATGPNTEIGKLGVALESVHPEETPLQREIGVLVRGFAAFGLLLSATIVVVYGLTRGHWLQGLLAGITLAMAVLPEEFPVVLTVFLALGAWRISLKHVLTRRMPAIEALGAATVLCVDKTGTLTLNQMSVDQLTVLGACYDVGVLPEQPPSEIFHPLIEFGILASERDPFDPTERAIKDFGSRYLARTEHLHADWMLVREYPLSDKLLAMSHVWRSPDGRNYVIAAKGSPEAVADLCHLSDECRKQVARDVNAMAAEGLRVLGVARACFEETTPLPTEQHDFSFEFLGLVGLMDPVRPAVPNAVSECYDAGIRVIMITGDYPLTARSVAHRIGLRCSDEIITGYELDEMSDSGLRERIRSTNVFARVVPVQKLRLVGVLKANGEVVAMTGDGVNDAPALKAADIGIAMGGRGTDVARESAVLVVLDDDFSSIVAAIRLGRRVFDNLKKAMSYILAIHVPIAGMSLVPVLMGWPLALMPVQIVFLQLIIDPVCSIAFEAEPEEADVMKRPPRDPHAPLFSRSTIGLSLLQGLTVLIIVLTVYAAALDRGLGGDGARAMAFSCLVIANLSLILTNRSWTRSIPATFRTPNPALWWVIGIALTMLGIVLYVPFFRELFRFSVLPVADLAISFAAGASGVLWFEALKVIGARRRRRHLPGLQS